MKCSRRSPSGADLTVRTIEIEEQLFLEPVAWGTWGRPKPPSWMVYTMCDRNQTMGVVSLVRHLHCLHRMARIFDDSGWHEVAIAARRHADELLRKAGA